MEVQLAEKCWKCQYLDLCPHCAAGEVSEGEFGIAPQYQCDFTNEYIRILKEELEK